MSWSWKKWGVSDGECELVYPCDRYLDGPVEEYYRGVTVDAQPETVFRWLCQMQVAPYSYDWIDNLGRRSPQELTPGLGALEVGLGFMKVFELVQFETDRHLTIRMKKNQTGHDIFGDTVVSYVILPGEEGSCRLLVKICIRYAGGILGRVMGLILPPGDWIMMRRQLLNFKALSERTERSP
jgi:hypothetical protein